MSRRWSATDIAEYDSHRRTRDGYVEVKTARRGQHKSPYLYAAAAYCRQLGVPEPVAEHYPLADREYRLDLAWPERKVGLELNGGIFIQGAHSRGAGQLRDMEKLNLCVAAGWRIFYATPDLAAMGRTIMLIANSCLR